MSTMRLDIRERRFLLRRLMYVSDKSLSEKKDLESNDDLQSRVVLGCYPCLTCQRRSLAAGLGYLRISRLLVKEQIQG